MKNLVYRNDINTATLQYLKTLKFTTSKLKINLRNIIPKKNCYL